MDAMTRLGGFWHALLWLWRRYLVKSRKPAFSLGVPARDTRGLLAPGVAFHLRTEVIPPPDDEDEAIAAFRDATRRRLASGILFEELGAAAVSGAVVYARIEATIGEGPRHLLAVYRKR